MFVTLQTLVGQRYGSRPLPRKIPQAELDQITTALGESGSSDTLSVIEKWYKLDENSLPPEYVLQPLSTIGKTGLSDADFRSLREDNPQTVRKGKI